MHALSAETQVLLAAHQLKKAGIKLSEHAVDRLFEQRLVPGWVRVSMGQFPLRKQAKQMTSCGQIRKTVGRHAGRHTAFRTLTVWLWLRTDSQQ